MPTNAANPAGPLATTAHPTAQNQQAGSSLAGYLTNDIQANADHAKQVLQHLEAVRSGQESAWSESGNAYVVTITPTTVTLNSHWANEGDPDTETLTPEDFRLALQSWIDTLPQPPA